MSTVLISSAIAQLAQSEIERSRFLQNPYFQALSDDSMSRLEFLRTQGQFFHAVRHFTHPMLLLLSRIPDQNARLALLHNVVEEHGEFEPAQFHQSTFRAFLASLGEEKDPPLAGPEVLAFNAALSGVCGHQKVETGVCCLGVIEYAFASVSALIGTSVVRRGWVAQEDLVHYALHAEIDQRHAAELFEIVESDPTHDQQAVVEGLSLGIYLFDRLHRDLTLSEADSPASGSLRR